MPTAIAYQRWSTPEQGDGDSKKRQDDLVQSYCAEKGLELLDTHIDAGVSAFRGSNATKGKLRVLRNELEDGRLKVDYILIEAFDRMSRDTAIDAIQLLSSIVTLGPTLVTLDDRQEYSKKSLRENPTQLFWVLVQTMRGQNESLTKSRRVKDAWRSKRSNALSKPMTAKGPPWLKLDKANNQFQIITDKAQVVRDIYEMASKGQSLAGITKTLNGLKVPPITQSDFWYRQQVLRILSTKAVIGIHEPMTTAYELDENDDIQKIKTAVDEIPNYYPAIIDEELAHKVWVLNKTRSSFKGTGKAAFITSGLAKCFACGKAMTYNIKRNNRYMVCSNYRVHGCTSNRLINYNYIEGLLANNLYELLDYHSPKAEDTKVTDLKQAMDENEQEIGRLVDAIRIRGFEGSIGQALDSLENDRKRLTQEMAEVSQRVSKPVLENDIVNLKNSLAGRDPIPEINQHMRIVMKSIVIDLKINVIELTFVDGSRAFMPLGSLRERRRQSIGKRLRKEP
jgi:DNA invertase Pin-like site-specific DNA recombinase